MKNAISQKRIVVCDDDVDIMRELFALLFRDRLKNVEFCFAASSNEAWSFFERGKIDLMTTDLVRPEGDPVEFIRRVKQVYPDTEVIVFSGSRKPYSDALAAGASREFNKPNDFKALADYLLEWSGV